MIRTATFSTCRLYRYSLWRAWNCKPAKGRYTIFRGRYAMFIGLNPSTADETNDDPTVRRCIRYAQAWGFDGLCMTNIFAYRATLPADMKVIDDPVGPDNDRALCDLAKGAAIVVAAWGTHGAHVDRHNAVRAMLPSLHYLRLTKDGYPGHPLYLPKTLKPIKWPR